MPRRPATPTNPSALVGLLKLLPHLTLGELLDAEPAARHVTLGELLGEARTVVASPRKTAAPVSPKTKRARAAAEVDTRTAAGRQAYDAKVLAALRAAKGPMTAREVLASIGGTNLQLIVAVKRLGRRVRKIGKTVSTKYEAT